MVSTPTISILAITVLSEKEKEQVLAYCDQKLSQRTIAKKIGRSKTVFHSFLKLKESYGARKALKETEKY